MNWSKEWVNPEKLDSHPPSRELITPDGQATIKFSNGEMFIGTLVGDLVVYDNWGWHVAHYPTMSRFDKAVPPGNWTKKQLLSWCDRVQQAHGQLWAILRALTPDDYYDKALAEKAQIKEWCLSVEV